MSSYPKIHELIKDSTIVLQSDINKYQFTNNDLVPICSHIYSLIDIGNFIEEERFKCDRCNQSINLKNIELTINKPSFKELFDDLSRLISSSLYTLLLWKSGHLKKDNIDNASKLYKILLNEFNKSDISLEDYKHHIIPTQDLPELSNLQKSKIYIYSKYLGMYMDKRKIQLTKKQLTNYPLLDRDFIFIRLIRFIELSIVTTSKDIDAIFDIGKFSVILGMSKQEVYTIEHIRKDIKAAILSILNLVVEYLYRFYFNIDINISINTVLIFNKINRLYVKDENLYRLFSTLYNGDINLLKITLSGFLTNVLIKSYKLEVPLYDNLLVGYFSSLTDFQRIDKEHMLILRDKILDRACIQFETNIKNIGIFIDNNLFKKHLFLYGDKIDSV